MLSVACIMMQKNEGELLRTWIEYHGQLFGYHNLYIFDNNSTDQHTLNIIRKYQDVGISFNRAFKDVDAHTKRHAIWAVHINRLEAYGSPFDFIMLLDCDEFLVFRNSATDITADPKTIHGELSKLKAIDQVLGIDIAYYNILNQPDHFFAWPQRKSFFRGGTFYRVDSGAHEGESRLASGKYQTAFAHMHYHHKPYATLVKHSKEKLRAFFDVDDDEQLRKPENSNRLTDFILAGEESYMNKFKTTSGVFLPKFRERLLSIGLEMPF